MNRYYMQRTAGRAPACRTSSCEEHKEPPCEERHSKCAGARTASDLALAMAYVPDQNWEEPMSGESAIKCGTAFESLVFPFVGG